MAMAYALLITGGCGYIGSHIGLYLAQQGHRVILLDYKKHDPKQFPWAEVIHGNCGDPQLLDHIFTQYSFDAVIHCAAFIEVSTSITNPLMFYQNNVSNTITLLNAMRQYQCNTIIFSSSCAVYGIPTHVPINEEHPHKPISPYGTSKSMVEQILHDVCHAHQINYISLRYFNAAGTYPGSGLAERHEPETHVIPLLLRAIHENKPFYICGNQYPTPDGTCIRDFLHVWDIADAHAQALIYLMTHKQSDSFNLGTGIGTSIATLVEIAKKIGNSSIPIIYGPNRPGDPAMLVADVRKVENILHWKARYSDLPYIIETAYESLFPKSLGRNLKNIGNCI